MTPENGLQRAVVNAPRVTVILPTYNRERLLPRSIRSVLCQTFQDFELLVVDDGSMDNTREVVAGIADPRLRYLRLEKNSGVSSARNAGIREARGDFIAFQDSDDEWLPDKLARQLQLLDQQPDVAMTFCSLVRVDITVPVARVKPATRLPANQDSFLRELLKVNFIWTQTWLVRAAVLKNGLAFNPVMRRGEDWDLALRIARQHRVAHLPEALVLAHVTPGSLAQQAYQKALDLQIIIQSHAELFARHPDILAAHYRRIAALLAEHETAASARQWASRALKLEPWNPRNIAGWLLLLFGRSALARAHRLKNALEN